MLYETVWMIYALGVGLFLSIGLLGLTFSLSIAVKSIRVVSMVLSVLIIFSGIYFSYRWNAEKKEIQALGQQVEQTLNQYLAKHKK